MATRVPSIINERYPCRAGGNELINTLRAAAPADLFIFFFVKCT